MDPHVVFDCHEIVPNRFALTMVAAARARALNRGAEPRISDFALHEIAVGAFSQGELAPFLPGLASTTLLPAPDPTTTELRCDGVASAAAAPVSCPRETVH